MMQSHFYCFISDAARRPCIKEKLVQVVSVSSPIGVMKLVVKTPLQFASPLLLTVIGIISVVKHYLDLELVRMGWCEFLYHLHDFPFDCSNDISHRTCRVNHNQDSCLLIRLPDVKKERVISFYLVSQNLISLFYWYLVLFFCLIDFSLSFGIYLS